MLFFQQSCGTKSSWRQAGAEANAGQHLCQGPGCRDTGHPQQVHRQRRTEELVHQMVVLQFRDLDRLENRTQVNPLKFKEGKRKVLHLGRHSPWQPDVLGAGKAALQRRI